ncbi:MAG: orotidine-5'-phosphate decarboxylase [Chloroflexota bacterium]
MKTLRSMGQRGRVRMTGWVDKLEASSVANDTLLCVGLDPDPSRMPITDVAAFNREIVDATREFVCAYKPQLAFYEALGIPGMRALEETIAHIRAKAPHALIIGDAKRGDIGSTASAYARAMFDVWGFDVVTVHPYMGRDSVEPFLERPDRGALVVCRTSNPGAPELQDLPVQGGKHLLYEAVAEAVERWNARGNAGIVVGATYPEELESLRRAHPGLPILIPGVGAQGGDVARATRAGVNGQGRGVLLNSSRGVLYASTDPESFAEAAGRAARELRDEINAARQEMPTLHE